MKQTTSQNMETFTSSVDDGIALTIDLNNDGIVDLFGNTVSKIQYRRYIKEWKKTRNNFSNKKKGAKQ